MGIGNVHTIGGIVLGTTNIHSVENESVNPAFQEYIDYGAGQVDPCYVAMMAGEPMVSFDTKELAIIMDAVGIDGLAIPSNTADVYFTKMANKGTRSSGSTHFRVRINSALVLVTRIAATQGQAATASVEIHAIYDGTNNPFVLTDSVALPFTPSITTAFTVGIVSVNGTELNGVQSINWDVGYTPIKLSSGGEIWPTFVGIGQRTPRFEITTKEVLALNTFGITGTAQGVTASRVHFQKMSKFGSRVAAATEEHIRLTINASQGMIWPTTVSHNNNQAGDCSLVFQPVVGSSAVLTIDTTAANQAT